MSSPVPSLVAVEPALLGLLRGNDWFAEESIKVLDEPPDVPKQLRSAGRWETIFIGDDADSDQEVPFLAGGEVWRDEEWNLTLVIQVIQPSRSGTRASVTARLFEIYEHVGRTLIGNIDLGLDPTYDRLEALITRTRLRRGRLAPGHGGRLELGVHIDARLSPS